MIEIDPALDAEAQLALLGVKLEDVLHELDYRRQRKAEKMRTEMALAAKAGGVRRILAGGEQGGFVDLMIHPTSFHYWGQRLGYECWDDPQFRREYKRDNEAARVRSVSDKLTIMKPTAAAGDPTARRRGPVGKRGRWAA